MKLSALLIVLVILFSSCASTMQARKCNGQKGTRVPMGVL